MLRRMKDWIRSTIQSFHSRDMESGSWNRRVGRPATLLWFVIMTAYHVVTGMNLVPASQITNFTLSYIMVQLVLGFVLITTLVKVYGKPGARYITALFLVAIIVGLLAGLLAIM